MHFNIALVVARDARYTLVGAHPPDVGPISALLPLMAEESSGACNTRHRTRSLSSKFQYSGHQLFIGQFDKCPL